MRCSLLTLSCLVDGELDPTRRGQVEAHIVACARCRAGVEHLREEADRIRHLARVHVPDDSVRALLEQLDILEPEAELPPRADADAVGANDEQPPWLRGEAGPALPWTAPPRQPRAIARDHEGAGAAILGALTLRRADELGGVPVVPFDARLLRPAAAATPPPAGAASQAGAAPPTPAETAALPSSAGAEPAPPAAAPSGDASSSPVPVAAEDRTPTAVPAGPYGPRWPAMPGPGGAAEPADAPAGGPDAPPASPGADDAGPDPLPPGVIRAMAAVRRAALARIELLTASASASASASTSTSTSTSASTSTGSGAAPAGTAAAPAGTTAPAEASLGGIARRAAPSPALTSASREATFSQPSRQGVLTLADPAVAGAVPDITARPLPAAGRAEPHGQRARPADGATAASPPPRPASAPVQGEIEVAVRTPDSPFAPPPQPPFHPVDDGDAARTSPPVDDETERFAPPLADDRDEDVRAADHRPSDAATTTRAGAGGPLPAPRPSVVDRVRERVALRRTLGTRAVDDGEDGVEVVSGIGAPQRRSGGARGDLARRRQEALRPAGGAEADLLGAPDVAPPRRRVEPDVRQMLPPPARPAMPHLDRSGRPAPPSVLSGARLPGVRSPGIRSLAPDLEDPVVARGGPAEGVTPAVPGAPRSARARELGPERRAPRREAPSAAELRDGRRLLVIFAVAALTVLVVGHVSGRTVTPIPGSDVAESAQSPATSQGAAGTSSGSQPAQAPAQAAPSAPPSAAPSQAPASQSIGAGGTGWTVGSVRFGGHTGYYRVVFDLSGAPGAPPPTASLAGSGSRTLVLTLAGTAPAAAPVGAPSGALVTGVVVAPSTVAGSTVYRIQLSRTATAKLLLVGGPERVILDITPS